MSDRAPPRPSTALFRQARDRMLQGQDSYHWPRDLAFNWAVDWFDQVSDPGRLALIVWKQGLAVLATYGELSSASGRMAQWLRGQGVRPGDRMMVVMRNSVDFYALSLAMMKLGAVMIPSFTSVSFAELSQRMTRARARHLAIDHDLAQRLHGMDVPGLKLVAGVRPADAEAGWQPLSASAACNEVLTDPWRGAPESPLMGFFTSGTTSQPKLVLHSHQSYPIGHLSSLHWQGVRPSDIHANVSSPGWAKHAWSSLFVPFSAEATVLTFSEERPAGPDCLRALDTHGATSFCAPPSYWRSLVRQGLGPRPRSLGNAVSAGESLDAGVIQAVKRAWGLAVRDGYGQTEMTALIGFGPGQESLPGAMGKALPGSEALRLVDPQTGRVGDEGEICLDLSGSPIALMLGYVDGSGEPRRPQGPYYRTGDLARRDAEGRFHLLGRGDDVFKSYDVRISPIELERQLLEHPQVMEVAVFLVLDGSGEPVPGAAVVPADPGQRQALPERLLAWHRTRSAPEQCVRRVWTVDELPRTASGKIHRARLRATFTHSNPPPPDTSRNAS